jgi:hypothetical protein
MVIVAAFQLEQVTSRMAETRLATNERGALASVGVIRLSLLLTYGSSRR